MVVVFFDSGKRIEDIFQKKYGIEIVDYNIYTKCLKRDFIQSDEKELYIFTLSKKMEY